MLICFFCVSFPHLCHWCVERDSCDGDDSGDLCVAKRLPVFQFLAPCHDKVSRIFFLNEVEPNLADLFCMFLCVEESWRRWFITIISHSVCKEALIIPDHCYSAAESDSKMGKMAPPSVIRW